MTLFDQIKKTGRVMGMALIVPLVLTATLAQSAFGQQPAGDDYSPGAFAGAKAAQPGPSVRRSNPGNIYFPGGSPRGGIGFHFSTNGGSGGTTVTSSWGKPYNLNTEYSTREHYSNSTSWKVNRNPVNGKGLILKHGR